MDEQEGPVFQVGTVGERFFCLTWPMLSRCESQGEPDNRVRTSGNEKTRLK